MTKDEHKEYMKAYYEAHKEECKAAQKAYYAAHKEAHKDKVKAWKEANKDKVKAWNEANKEQVKEYKKAYNQAHKEQIKAYQKEYKKAYNKSDLNTLGQTKQSIRMKSKYYLKKYGNIIPGYQIHHCCTYTEPYKFIYCSREMHHLIHAYLRQHNIDADSDHYDYIKHLLDDSVIKYNL